jgi:HAD superfamily hydrolase (TIGR01509 family)
VPAILFGSLSTLADTSEMQREAFNTAFSEHGLSWRWDRDDYQAMLESNGGAQRIAEQAAAHGEQVDADAVHATKSEVFRERVRADGIAPRPGVLGTIKAAHGRGVTVGLVTTTSKENVDALVEALGPDLTRTDFALLVDRGTVAAAKPDPAAWTHALAALGETPDSVVAVEDNVGGVASALAAGIRVVAFPNANTAGHDFSAATERVETLDDGALLAGLARS